MATSEGTDTISIGIRICILLTQHYPFSFKKKSESSRNQISIDSSLLVEKKAVHHPLKKKKTLIKKCICRSVLKDLIATQYKKIYEASYLAVVGSQSLLRHLRQSISACNNKDKTSSANHFVNNVSHWSQCLSACCRTVTMLKASKLFTT